MNRIAAYLNRYIDGVAYSTPNVLSAYTTDRSLLKYHPRLVVVPASTRDICRILRFSFQLSKKQIPLPITVRGAGYSKTGSAIGNGVVLSTTELNRIIEIDPRQRLVHVQAGVSYHTVLQALHRQGLDLALQADPHETMGGIVARGARGSINCEAMDISDIINSVECVLYDGTIIQSGRLKLAKSRTDKKLKTTEREIYAKLADLAPKTTKLQASREQAGYAGLSALNQKNFDLKKLIAGSEGSLAVISEIIFRCESIYEKPETVAILCRTHRQFVQLGQLLKTLKFTNLNFYDTAIFNAKDSTGKDTNFFRKADDNGFLLTAQIRDDSAFRRRLAIKKLQHKLPKELKIIQANSENATEFTSLQQKLSAYLNDNSTSINLPILDDIYVPAKTQFKFLEQADQLATKLNLKCAFYGNLDHDLFTVRPSFNPANAEDRRKLVIFLRSYLKIIHELGVTVCGNASDGRFVAIFNNASRSSLELSLESEIKAIFDPVQILNPGIKGQADAKTTLKHFRISYESGILPND